MQLITPSQPEKTEYKHLRILFYILIYDYIRYLRRNTLLFTQIANRTCLVDFAAVGASCDDAVSTDGNSLHKFQAARRHRTYRLRRQRRQVGEGSERPAAARQLITLWQIAEPGVLLVTSEAPDQVVPCSCRPFSSANGAFLSVDYARRIPRDLRERRKHANRGNGGLQCLLRDPCWWG